MKFWMMVTLGNLELFGYFHLRFKESTKWYEMVQPLYWRSIRYLNFESLHGGTFPLHRVARFSEFCTSRIRQGTKRYNIVQKISIRVKTFFFCMLALIWCRRWHFRNFFSFISTKHTKRYILLFSDLTKLNLWNFVIIIIIKIFGNRQIKCTKSTERYNIFIKRSIRDGS